VIQLKRCRKIIRETYFYFFPSMSIFDDENFYCWGECNTQDNSYRIKTNLELVLEINKITPQY